MKERRKTIAQLCEENATLSQIVQRKEWASDIPRFAWSVFALSTALNVMVFLPLDQGVLLLGLASLCLLLGLGQATGENVAYQRILGQKAYAMGCPTQTSYQNKRGTSGYYTYVVVSASAYQQLLSYRVKDSVFPSSEEVLATKRFSKKILLEKVERKEDIGKTLGNSPQ